MNIMTKIVMNMRLFKAAAFLVSSILFTASASALTIPVNCPGDSIQATLDANAAESDLVLEISGICRELVTVVHDNRTFDGLGMAMLKGTLTVDGARRSVVTNLEIRGRGNGVVVTRNGTATVENAIIRRNHDNGIVILDGAQAEIMNNRIVNNGLSPSDPDQGAGVWVGDSANARIIDNAINNNLSYGVEVFNGAMVRLESNRIKRNGRPALVESGLGVYTARVRAYGNIYEDNAYAAIDAYNGASYRTGRGLSSAGVTDNPSGFERISAGTGVVAVTIGRGSLVDLRQVIVQGTIEIESDNMLHVRGDDIGPSTQCSEVDDVNAFGVNNSIAMNRYVRVNGVVTANPNQGNRVASNTGCPLP